MDSFSAMSDSKAQVRPSAAGSPSFEAGLVSPTHIGTQPAASATSRCAPLLQASADDFRAEAAAAAALLGARDQAAAPRLQPATPTGHSPTLAAAEPGMSGGRPMWAHGGDGWTPGASHAQTGAPPGLGQHQGQHRFMPMWTPAGGGAGSPPASASHPQPARDATSMPLQPPASLAIHSSASVSTPMHMALSGDPLGMQPQQRAPQHLPHQMMQAPPQPQSQAHGHPHGHPHGPPTQRAQPQPQGQHGHHAGGPPPASHGMMHLPPAPHGHGFLGPSSQQRGQGYVTMLTGYHHMQGQDGRMYSMMPMGSRMDGQRQHSMGQQHPTGPPPWPGAGSYMPDARQFDPHALRTMAPAPQVPKPRATKRSRSGGDDSVEGDRGTATTPTQDGEGGSAAVRPRMELVQPPSRSAAVGTMPRQTSGAPPGPPPASEGDAIATRALVGMHLGMPGSSGHWQHNTGLHHPFTDMHSRPVHRSPVSDQAHLSALVPVSGYAGGQPEHLPMAAPAEGSWAPPPASQLHRGPPMGAPVPTPYLPGASTSTAPYAGYVPPPHDGMPVGASAADMAFRERFEPRGAAMHGPAPRGRGAAAGGSRAGPAAASHLLPAGGREPGADGSIVNFDALAARGIDVSAMAMRGRETRSAAAQIPAPALRLLFGWLVANLRWPFPSRAVKEAIAGQTGLDQSKVKYWFSNVRKRHWVRVIANGEQPRSQMDVDLVIVAKNLGLPIGAGKEEFERRFSEE